MNLYDVLLAKKLNGEGGGGDVTVQSLNVTSNGTYTAPSNKAYSPVNVNVPTGITPSGTLSVSANGTYDVTNYASADVDVASVDALAKRISGQQFSYSSDEPTTLIKYAFSMTNIVSCSLPNVTTASDAVFENCASLVSLYTPNLGVIPGYYCSNCTALEDYDFSNTTNISSANSFANTKLKGVYAPRCANIGGFTQNQFKGCSDLVYARFPIAAQLAVRSGTFENCTSLKLVDLGAFARGGNITIGTAGDIFKGCPILETLIIRSAIVVGYSRTADFDSVTSPVNVYVPSALKSTYQTATNWSTYVANNKVVFKDLEGSPYEQPNFSYMGVPA